MQLRVTIFVLVLTGPAFAEKVPREILTYQPAKPTPAPAYLTPIVVPTATSFVVNDQLGLLFVTHRPQRAKDTPKAGVPWPQFTFAKLDAAGVPGPFKPIALPKPATLAKANYPLGITFHPKLPLMYVWQDIEAVEPRAEATDAPVYKDFDHVLIYHIDGAEPEFLMSFGRGPKFAFGLGFAAMAIDPAGTRLFVGNLQHRAPKDQINGAVGYFRLAADGLPELEAESRTPAADRAARVAAAKALTPKVATAADGGLRKISTDKYGLLWAQPCGLGMAAVSADVLLFGGGNGPFVWEPANGRAELQATYIPPYYRPANLGDLDRLAVHPTLPVAYGLTTAAEGAIWTDSFLYRTEHADGFPTLLPQRMILYYFRASTPPVLLPKHKQIAFGGEKRVGMIAIDDQGRLMKDRIEIEVNSPRVQGLAYSAKFDKLYVGVDEDPPKAKEPKK